MFKPALRNFARLLPFVAALLVSVTVAASTRAPGTADVATMSAPALPKAPSLVALQSIEPVEVLRGRLSTTYGPLFASADSVALLAASYPVDILDTALTIPVTLTAPRADVRSQHEWPRPDRWMALLATLGLGAFFFLRRIV